TPDRYVEIGGAKLNELSYQLARSYCVPCQGVYAAEPSGMFRLDGPDHGWIINSIDNKPTPNLDTFISVMQSIPDRERVPVVYHSIADFHTTSVAVIQVERHWSRFRLAVRNDTTGRWDFTDLGAPLSPKAIQPATARFIQLDESVGPAKDLIRSLVKVSYYMPCRIDGFPKSRKQGAGLVLDHARGLIVVSRSIVPFAMGDLSITFADTIIVPGKIEYLHPSHNFAFVRYDPALVGETDVNSAPLSKDMLLQGHKVTLVAFNHNQRPVCLTTVVTDITSVTIPQNSTPRFRSVNLDAITLDTPLAQQCSSGVLADSHGHVQGLWLSYLGERNMSGHDNEYHLGLHIHTVLPVLTALQKDEVPSLRSLNVELMPVQMAQAVAMGLGQEWVRKVEEANSAKHQLFLIRRTETGSESAKVLEELDLILAVNGKTVTRMYEMDVQYEAEELEMTILRKKEEMTIKVPTSPVSGDGTSRVVMWAGAALQEPHKAVLQQSKTLPSRIYVSARSKGSPAYMYGMVSGQTLSVRIADLPRDHHYSFTRTNALASTHDLQVPTQWITHINGTPTPDLDAFVEAVRLCPDNTYVRVKTISFDNIPMVLSVKNNLHYWPTIDMVKDSTAECGWRKNEVV
ncbi:PDZ-like domain-containing protein, partial [Jimgerdemannia flammicorona]